jgi:hypothetical protein
VLPVLKKKSSRLVVADGSQADIDDGAEMERTPVDSSAVLSVGYDEFRQVLELEYVDSDVYQYFDVPKALHQALLDAPSIGQFVNTQIKGAFRCEKLRFEELRSATTESR